MGNSNSSSESDDDINAENKDDDDSFSEGESDLTEQEIPQSVDLRGLFNAVSLRSAASKIKEEVRENILQTHHGYLVRYLEERLQRNEETISQSQFIDCLLMRGVKREDCIQAFHQFDCEGDGTADVCTMLETLKVSNGTGHSKGELASVVRTLQACTLTPGFIDVYNEDKTTIGKHGTRILNFLLRNRSSSNALPYPCLNGFSNTMHMRLRSINHIFTKLKEAACSPDKAITLPNEETRLITKCFSSYEVSTNKHEAYRLFSRDATYWQSDGSARSHWIRLRIKKNVVIKQLSINVSASDQSYMPEIVTVSVSKGRSHNLKEIREVKIAAHITGSVMLLENMKTHYPLIQINIRRCHNDGCDVRIRGLKTLGHRVIKEAGVNVTDASIAWYLQIMASTATANLPTSPHLRDTILQHTKSALKSMAPLSLCPASSEKPSFLSPHVLDQMDAFIRDMAFNSDGQITSTGLQVLLTFSLARGHVSNILKAMQFLQENPELEIKSSGLLRSLNTVKDEYLRKHGGQVCLKLAGCDGGQKEESSGPSNVLNNNWTTSQVYLSDSGKTKVNMVFQSSEYVQITKIRMKVAKGPRGPKRGMVFVYNHPGEFDMDAHAEKMQGYDSWGAKEYAFCSMVRSTGIGGKPDNPVAYFTVDEEWDEIEIPMDVCALGKFVMVKFLEPRQPSSERIGVMGIKFYGFVRKSVFVDNVDLDQLSSLPEKDDGCVGLDSVPPRVLSFLGCLARDQVSSTHVGSLVMSGVSVELLLSIYQGFSSLLCQNLTLQLFHAVFPHLTGQKSVDEHSKEVSETFFKKLASLVDNYQSSENAEERYIVNVARQVIIDGAAVFFPDKEARRKQLFSMITDVNTSLEAPSVSLTFQSLCQFFSSVDPSALLDLPDKVPEDYNSDSVLAVMDTLVSVAHREYLHVLSTKKITEQSPHLVALLCSLQTSLTSWCHCQIHSECAHSSKTAQDILVKYIGLISSKCSSALDLFNGKSEQEMADLMTNLEGSFLSTTLRQIVLILTLLSDNLLSSNRTLLLQSLLPIAKSLKSISPRLPAFFYELESEHWKEMEKGIVTLRTWEVESTHNYQNNQHTLQIFSCLGATDFVVEFDEKCETEKRYDYLEFTDAMGNKTRYDQKVGTDRWPLKVTFKGGHWLQFLFHSDSSNNDWGYKFKVTAMGSPDIPLCWMFDLHLSLAKLLGRLCGATLAVNQVLTNKPDDVQSEEELELFKSELWTTLFRGGYMVGKLQRSLSGKYVTEDDTEASTLLWSMVEATDGLGPEFLKKCADHCSPGVGPLLGGDEVSAAVNAVFAALVWHTQSLREDLQKYAKSGGEGRISDGLYQAYTSAQALRTFLIDKRQKQIVIAENSGREELLYNPVEACKEKALFLLKFSGLSKIHLKSETKSKIDRRGSKFHNRISSDRVLRLDSIIEKYPSFRLVFDFVKDPAWSKSSVEKLLQKRTQQASCVAEVYLWTSEYMRIMGEESIFQLPIIQFLQDLFAYQNRFAEHYAEGMDGCGLQQEARVRTAYYSLVRRMVDAVRSVKRLELPRPAIAAYDFVQACTLHLLDVNWQLYDLYLLVELKIPEVFMSMAKESVTMREKVVSDISEDDQLADYKRCMNWLKECRDGFVAWYDQQNRSLEKDKEERKMVQMFVARFCDLLDVEISCDGCGVTLPGRRYRCLQCKDMDLCATCYAGGVKPVGEHTDDHEIVHLMYKCDECQAFIVGTRIHCLVCEDFDLCLGCFNAGHFPAGHGTDHEVMKIPLVKWKLNTDLDSSLLSYIHQHVWLLFSSMALSMANILYHASASHSAIDVDYIKAATTLHGQCIHLAIKCLMQTAATVDEEGAVDSLASRMARQEEAFAVHSQERIMGLLGAMIPAENQSALAEDVSLAFVSENFLKLLFSIARGETNHETNTQHFALGLIGQLLQRATVTRKVVDSAVSASDGTSSSEDTDSEQILVESSEGEKTAEFLFSFGALCLERSGLEWANSMSGILQRLFNAPAWREILLAQLTKCIQDLKTKPQLSSIFALFVVADFPEVLSIGSHVKYCDLGTEYKHGMVLKHFTDKNGTLLVDVKSRRRRTMKDEYVESISYDIQALLPDHITAFIDVITEISSRYRRGESLSVESGWVLALSLKALLKSLRSSNSILKTSHHVEDRNTVIQELYKKEFVQCVVHLATQGTKFSKQWLLKDLEILSLMLYTKEHDRSEESETDAPSSSGGATKIKAMAAAAASEKTEPKAKDPWEGLDDPARLCFQTVHEHFRVPVTLLRAIYDMHGQNTNALLLAVHEDIDGDVFRPSEKVIEMAKNWEKSKLAAEHESAADQAEDVGMQLTDLPKMEKKVMEEALPEPAEDSQKLIQTVDNENQNESVKFRKAKSSAALKKELEAHGRNASREYLVKVNIALSVLFSRQIVAALLADWPSSGHVIKADLIGCKEQSHVPIVLDLLNRNETKETFQKVVHNVVKHCEPAELVPIAMTSCQFMEEVNLSTVICESEHNYKDNTEFSDKVHIPGSTSLQIKFDSRCSTEDACDVLVMASSPDFKQDKHTFSGSKENWFDFDLPGDTLYYKFESDGSENDWGYRFSVTGGRMGRFDTGYMILNGILSMPSVNRLLPVGNLWSSLVYVVCKQTGQQRLKGIQLLLRVLHMQSKSQQNPHLQIELSELAPLWHLYTSRSAAQSDASSMICPVVRALTELFFVAENLALEWGISEQYAVSLKHKDEILQMAFQGLRNIAAVSLQIGVTNKATEAFAEFKARESQMLTIGGSPLFFGMHS